jgi:hypothetical protein
VRDEGSTVMKLKPAGGASEADMGESVRREDSDDEALGVNVTGLSIFNQRDGTRDETPSD